MPFFTVELYNDVQSCAQTTEAINLPCLLNFFGSTESDFSSFCSSCKVLWTSPLLWDQTRDMPLSPRKSLVVSCPPAPLEDSITFYFEACHVTRWHNPDHIYVNLSDYIAYLRAGILWNNVLIGWGKVRSTNRLCISYFSLWRKRRWSASQTYCTVTVHLRENFSFSPDSSFVNINFCYLSVLVFQELCKCKH